ncbi:MAG TPA: MFS transporter [Planctomycetes bacterium]|nr:MFS transporter [Fuerstiella sp.]HIK90845.1 MFS transporter [Planctomycetota bacterium]
MPRITETQPELPETQIASEAAENDRAEGRNVLTLVLHQILFRTAWIFKTESVILPAFLDSITDVGWVRGMLPPLNRFSQSLAPVLLSDRLGRASLKSRWLARTTFLMAVPFLTVGGMLLLFGHSSPAWFVAFFLTAYAAFFCVCGVNQAAYNTIQGKLIRPDRRGRLAAIAGNAGSAVAVLMAWILLRPWTQHQPPHFAYIFLFTGAVFLLAGFTVRGLQEQSDPIVPRSPIDARRRFAVARQALRSDPHLRRLCILAALFVCSQLLFPHYQRLGRLQPGYEGRMLMVWVVAQNLSAAGFSWFSGRMADRRGTRAALRWLTFLAMFAPPLALALAEFADARWYWLAFAWLGLVPVTFRMMLNYALELTSRENHPIYVSTVVLCMAPPIILSPLVGDAVHRIGYVVPFCSITAVVVAAWGLSLVMVEPREVTFVQSVPANPTDDDDLRRRNDWPND